MPIRIGSEPGSLGGVDKVYVGSDLLWPSLWTAAQFGADMPVWYDTMEADTLTLSGFGVTAIANKGQLGGSAVAQSANLPVYDATGLDGLPEIRNDFGAGNGLVQDFGSALPTGDAPCTMVGVGRLLINDSFPRTQFLWGSDVDGISYRNIVGYQGLQYGHFSTANLIGGNTWLNVVLISSYEHEAGWNYGTVNGTDLSPVAEGVLTTTADPLLLLIENGVTLSEAMIINRILTADERQKLHGALHHKWGATANLPVLHPYKSAAPTL